jgi:hypothetical protein
VNNDVLWNSCYDGSACRKFMHKEKLVPYARDVFSAFVIAGATRWLRICMPCAIRCVLLQGWQQSVPTSCAVDCVTDGRRCMPRPNAGEELPVDNSVSHEFRPLYDHQQTVEFGIYSAESGRPVSCKDKGVKREGSVEVQLPKFVGKPRDVRACIQARLATA